VAGEGEGEIVEAPPQFPDGQLGEADGTTVPAGPT
jgi:hypothetical protein